MLAPHLPETETRALAEHYRRGLRGPARRRRRRGGTRRSTRARGRRWNGWRPSPGTLLGVATGKARRGLEHMLDHHGLGAFFATTQTADEHPSKPHPSMLRAALAETGVRRRRR